MSTLHAIPAGGSPLADPARTAAIHAVRTSIEYRLDRVLEFVDDYLYGDHAPISLADARNTLSMIGRELVALQQLGTPLSMHDFYADSL